MKKRIAIPVINGQLSQYFGECSHYEIFEIDGQNMERKEVNIPERTGVSELPVWLEENGITDVITFKVHPKIIHLFVSKKVNLFVGVPVDSPQKLIEDYLQGRLESDEKIIQELTYSTEN